jgi:hypothetical protein
MFLSRLYRSILDLARMRQRTLIAIKQPSIMWRATWAVAAHFYKTKMLIDARSMPLKGQRL